MKRRAKKLLSIMLAALVVTTTIPVQSVMAAEPEKTQQEVGVEQEKSQQEVTVESEEMQQESTAELGEIQQESPAESEEMQQESSVEPEIMQQETTVEQNVDQESSEVEDISSEDAVISYVVVTEPYIELNGTQNILVGLGEEGMDIQSPVLNVVREEDGAVFQIPVSSQDSEALLFTKQYMSEEETGTYRLESITYISNGVEVTKSLAEAGFDVRYGVNKEVETNPDGVLVDENEAEVPVVITDVDGNEIGGMSIEEAIDNVIGEDAYNIKGKTYGNNGTFVVVLDPGHGGSDTGATRTVNGVTYIERDINLKIAEYCKAELEQYLGVKVYLTRTDNTSPLMNRKERTDYAVSVGADVIVSLHINATGDQTTTAQGALIYCPNADTESGKISQGLSDKILEKLAELGLDTHRGKIPDESWGMVKYPKEYGIPGILVEHAFINNESDRVNYLSSDEKLKKLGVADATAIAEYFGLSKSNLDLNGICYIYRDNGIDIGVDYSTRGSNIRFQWMAYNLDTQQWEGISDWYNGNWATWQPKKGNYWLQVQALTDEGYSASQTICFHSDKNYDPYAVMISGICYQYQDKGVDIGVGYDSNDKNLQFQWLAYNLDTQQWEQISDWNGGNWATWKAKTGNYWLQVQVKNSLNQIETYTICFRNDRNYITEPLSIDGIAYVLQKDQIDIGVAYTGTEAGAEFRWMAYNLDAGYWAEVSSWSGANWTNWYPEPGNYWLHVEGRTPSGVTKDYTVCFAVGKDYSKKSLDITGICVVEEPIGINIGVAYETKASGVNFKYSIYDLKNGGWNDISGWTGANWVTWYPETGSYWIYVQAVTNEGVVADKCIGYSIDSRYGIMGTSNTTVEQMVRYYNANQAYPSFYQSSDAPTIEAFCQIYMEECNAEGVRAEVAFCQAMKETGFLRFTGRVPITAYNFGGMGAIDSDETAYATFSSVREGIRAQVQHLKAYAVKGTSTTSFKYPCVDPRLNDWFTKNYSGTAPYVEWLGVNENPYGKGWATAKNYGYSIKKDYIAKLFTY